MPFTHGSDRLCFCVCICLFCFEKTVGKIWCIPKPCKNCWYHYVLCQWPSFHAWMTNTGGDGHYHNFFLPTITARLSRCIFSMRKRPSCTPQQDKSIVTWAAAAWLYTVKYFLFVGIQFSLFSWLALSTNLRSHEYWMLSQIETFLHFHVFIHI